MSISNKANLRKMEKMTERERCAFMASGKPTTQYIQRLVKDTVEGYWVAKLRQVALGDGKGMYKFSTKEEALAAAESHRQDLKKKAKE